MNNVYSSELWRLEYYIFDGFWITANNLSFFQILAITQKL